MLVNRNNESHFSMAPQVSIGRSRMNRNQSIKFSFNTGLLIPFYVDEVLPGDTHKIKTNKVVRLQTPLTPIMDNMYLDTYYFFVPNRLVWEHWKEFNGENTASPWTPSVEYTIPQLTTTDYAVPIGSALDYMGVPTGVKGLSFSALPERAYKLIWNEWFRDQNLQYPVPVPTGDASNIVSINAGTPLDGSSAAYRIGALVSVSKFHDYFTSALPSPQKGPDVSIQLLGDSFPVVSDGNPIGFSATADGTVVDTLARGSASPGFASGNLNAYFSTTGTVGDDLYAADPSGYKVDISTITLATINQLRTAFQLQKLYEKDARGGTRYTEILKTHFGVTSPDSRLQRPEYLGGNRIPINFNQVVQSSESNTSPQGTTAAYSLTADMHDDFVQSFTEHGYILGLCCVRYDHTYQQGLERFWSRQTRFDFYWPVFAHLGEQAILNKEIYADGSSADDEVFGYQEAWADYRYKPNRVAGEMRSSATASLDVWHLADDYNSLPSLSAGWIIEDKTNVDRVLSVASSVSNQLFADFYVQNETTRPMPVYSIPGLIDHF